MYLVLPVLFVVFIFIILLLSERRTIWIGFFAMLSLVSVILLLLYFGFNNQLYILTIIALIIFVLAFLPIPIYFIGFIIFLAYSGIVLLKKEGLRLTNLLSLLLAIILVFWLILPVYGQAVLSYEILTMIFLWLSLVLIYFLIQMIIFYFASAINAIYPLRKHYDYIIVLGSGLIGKEVTPLLAHRIDKAIQIYQLLGKRGKVPKIIFSGGQGKDEIIPEGEAMQQYAIHNGALIEDTLVENQSKNTFENINFSILLTSYQQAHIRQLKYLVVTSNFHLFRALLWTRKLKLICDGRGSKVKYYFWMNAFIREFIAILQFYKKTHIFFISLFSTIYLILMIVILIY